MWPNKEYIWLRKKGFFKSFAEQTDTFCFEFHDLASWKA